MGGLGRDPLEPLTGIGPAYTAWKAGVLPLNYSDEWCRERILLAPGGLPSIPSCQHRRRYSYPLSRVEPIGGLEPSTY